MLPRANRLTTSQFDRAFARSQTVRHPLVVLKAHFRGDGQETVRAAFVVPKKQGKATIRNRRRRRLRERFRLLPPSNQRNLAGCDLIFLATPQTHGATMFELDDALKEVLRRAGKRIGGENSPRKIVEETVASPLSITREASEEANETSLAATEKAIVESFETLKPILPLTFLALWIIRFYQRFISPGLPPSCRFEPSCSRYTYATIERFGLWRGGFLGLIRLCKCNPWHAGGEDPVPQHFPNFATKRSENQNRKFSWPFLGAIKPKK